MIPVKKLKYLFITMALLALLLTGFNSQAFFNLSDLFEPAPKFDAIPRIDKSVKIISANYYDPGKVNPKRMFEEGLNFLSIKVPELVIDFKDPSSKILLVSMGTVSKLIQVGELNSLGDILKPTSEIFEFVRTNYKGEEKPEELEYSFINGLLKPLDPHSNLLTPEVFREFKTQTEGEYGGIGIVVGIKDDELTVISPIEGTPASRKDIVTDDKIVEIDHVPTINMSLTEAVERLRGAVNSKVILTMQRKGREPVDIPIVRERIVIESIKSKLITHNGKKIGLLGIRSFQEDTFIDMAKALEKMKAEGPLAGIVMDMRNNPGGLLDQAIDIADQFLRDGDILFTVGANEQFDEVTKATAASDDDLKTPILVLVNQGSASASEIVSGALKNNSRAIIMGAQTFGKGSVQSLFNLRDGSSLKLTIAQYLTPGRISIQAVGITPDIMLTPSVIDPDNFDLRDDEYYGEKDLDEHIVNIQQPKSQQPKFSLKFLQPKKEKKDGDSEYTSKLDESTDAPLRLAIEFLSQTTHTDKAAILADFNIPLKKETVTQDAAITDALKKIGIDWSLNSTDTAGKPNLGVTYQFVNKQTNQPISVVKAGDEVLWNVYVKNKGSVDVARLIGVVQSENSFINQREFVFGRIHAGETQKAVITLKVPDEMFSFDERARIKFFSGKGDLGSINYVATKFEEKPRANLGYTYNLVDNGTLGSSGNGNQLPEKGEKLAMTLTIKNADGSPAAKNVTINLKNMDNEGIYLRQARSNVGALEGGKSASATLLFEVSPQFSQKEIKLELVVTDKGSRSGFLDTILIPSLVVEANTKPTPPLNTDLFSPQLDIQSIVVDASRKNLKLTASIKDNEAVKDVMIFADGKKVFYKLVSDDKKNQPNYQLETSLPLKAGSNIILLQARDQRLFSTQRSLNIMGEEKKDPTPVIPEM